MSSKELKRDRSELEEAIVGFEAITAELNYRKAQNSLRNLIGNIDLTAEEQMGLESDIDSPECHAR